MTDEARRGTPRITEDQWDKFILHLSKTANVSGAVRKAGIGCNKTAYAHRRDDAEFAERWEQALEMACDQVQEEMWRRGMKGVKKMVVSAGKLMGYDIVPSDALLIHLQKVHDPRVRAALAPQSATMVVPPLPADLEPDPLPIPDEPGPEHPVN